MRQNTWNGKRGGEHQCDDPWPPHTSNPKCLFETRASSVTGPIRVPPPTVTFRMRWLLLSATKMVPLASTSRPAGKKNPAFVPDPSAKAELVPLTPPASVVTTARSSKRNDTHNRNRITPLSLATKHNKQTLHYHQSNVHNHREKTEHVGQIHARRVEEWNIDARTTEPSHQRSKKVLNASAQNH